MRTFTDSEQFLAYMQSKYGSANFSRWQSIRKQFYSFIPYGAAGSSVFTFFGNAVGNAGLNRQLTNMPKAGSFGQQHFLLKAINMDMYIDDPKVASWDGTDASTLYSDIVNGFVHAGAFELIIGSRSELQIAKPFLYMPPGDGSPQLLSAGLQGLTLNEATPNTYNADLTAPPHAELLSRRESMYRVDPNILIEAEQNFETTLSFPSGAVPYLASAVINDSSNPLYIGVVLDGLLFRPVQ